MPWDLAGNGNTNETLNFVGTTDAHAFVIKTNATEALRVDPSGKIGVGGLPNSTSKVQIHAQDGVQISGYQPFFTLTDTNSGGMLARVQNADGKLVFYTQSALQAGIPSVVFNSLHAPSGSPLPTAIEVHAQDGMTIVGYQPFLTLNDSAGGYRIARIQTVNGDINLAPQNANGAVVIKSDSGFVGIGTSSPSAKLDVTGDIKVSGDILLSGRDCAEKFEVSGQAEPGTVLVIDEEGRLRQSCTEYDKKVAGVVSGAGEFRPGIVLGDEGEDTGRARVALIGRASCKVDASFAPIEAGDLLTTSPNPGYAMKVVEPAKAIGAILGKALRSISQGQALIPIFVALQ